MDFEASSLGKSGYPIEVGWVFENGKGEAHLIRPAPGWDDWDEDAAATHGLTRETLRRDGEPVGDVAARMVAELSAHDLYASAPSWDGKWMSLLLRAAGHPRHELRLRDTEVAFAEAAAERLGPEAGSEDIAALIAHARLSLDTEPVAHRALADARKELAIYDAVVRGV